MRKVILRKHLLSPGDRPIADASIGFCSIAGTTNIGGMLFLQATMRCFPSNNDDGGGSMSDQWLIFWVVGAENARKLLALK